MRKQYHFRPSPNGFFAWDVDRLVGLTAEFAPKDIKLDQIREIDEVYWFGYDQDGKNEPTVRAVSEHARLIQEADGSYPVILSSDGRVMDGMHRVAKALLQGRKTIMTVQFAEDPVPDYADVYPTELPY